MDTLLWQCLNSYTATTEVLSVDPGQALWSLRDPPPPEAEAMSNPAP